MMERLCFLPSLPFPHRTSINTSRSSRFCSGRALQRRRCIHFQCDPALARKRFDIPGLRAVATPPEMKENVEKPDVVALEEPAAQVTSNESRVLKDRLDFYRDYLARPKVLRRARRMATDEWLDNLLSLPRSSVLRRIWAPCAAVTGIALFVVILYTARPWRAIPTIPHMLLSSALGLLLVFRTNSAYAQYKEGRKSWGIIISRSRDFTRQVVEYFDDDMVPEDQRYEMRRIRDVCFLYTIAFGVALRCHLTDGKKLIRALRGLLDDKQLNELETTSHMPLFCVQRITNGLRRSLQCGMNPILVARMDECLSQMLYQVGTCERIVKTAIPLSYSRHTNRFMMIFCLTLPLVMVTELRWATIPAAFIVSYALLGIEEIGHQIEEPFSSLYHAVDIDSLSDQIVHDVIELSHFAGEPPLPDGADISSLLLYI